MRIKQSSKNDQVIQLSTIQVSRHIPEILTRADNYQTKSFEIAPFTHPTTWRLSQLDEQTKEMEETIVRFQAIVCNKQLPPINKPTDRKSVV